MMKIWVCLVALVVAWPAMADDRSDLQARYDKISAAMRSGDAAAIKAMQTADYQNADYGAQLRESLLVYMAGDHSPNFTFVRLTVDTVEVSGDTATVMQHLDIDDTNIVEVAHSKVWSFSYKDIWTRSGGDWRLQSSLQYAQQYTLDGRDVIPTDGYWKHLPPPPGDVFPDLVAGNPKSKVTVIMYGSVACPICERANQEVMSQFFAKYVKTGKVRYIYRPMEMGNSVVARAGHLLVECAAKEKRFDLISAIMDAQAEMDAGGQPEQYINARTVLPRIAAEYGISRAQFDACTGDTKGMDRMDRMNAAYLKAGIDGTPTLFVNGHEFYGFPDFERLDKVLRLMLK